MELLANLDFWYILYFFAMFAAGMFLIFFPPALLLLGWVIWRVKQINLPVDADLVTALQATPFAVVLLLDLLDLSLDFFSAPISWGILTYLGLQPLRGITVIESAIPGTQSIPTMTIAWVAVRLLKSSQAKNLFH